MDRELALGFWLINLVLPDHPDQLVVTGRHGNWLINKKHDYDGNMLLFKERPTIALETYTIEHENLHEYSVIVEELLEEIRHICLSISYLCGTAVTIKRSLPFSSIDFISVGDGYPRLRHLIHDNHVINEHHEFQTKLNLMIGNFTDNEANNNANIILHHYLDSLYCWSLEDLFLGICTVLEIIKQNEKRRLNKPKIHFYDAIESVSQNLGVITLNRDFKNMRDDLIHEGYLSKSSFSGHSKAECAEVVCNVLNWVDEYLHSIFSISPVSKQRYSIGELKTLNSYTTWN